MTAISLADALNDLDLDALSAWVEEQRWFSAKSREVTFGVRHAVPLGDDLGLVILEARAASGTHDLFQLLVSAVDDELVYDALAHPACAGAFFDLFPRRATAEAEGQVVAFQWSDSAPSTATDVRPLGAEQSNSSIVVDDEVILKVFRHLEPGENPELEMLQFLSAHGFARIPELVGWYELSGDLIDATLGVAQGFLRNADDGWELVLDHLASGRVDDVTPRLRELGAVIGEMHAVLGSDASDPDFAPEAPGDEALPLFMATVDEEIEQVFSSLPDHPVFAPIAGHGEDLRERLRFLSTGGTVGRLIRHHGDLHLGQTMLGPDGWTILDFEGEPSRPLIDRRRKRSPLRDVAGMLRSFAYAASAAARQGGTVPEGWEDEARAAFLEGYLETVDPALLPPGEAATAQVLSVFELEKAVYELRYEIDNRPEWAAIPVAGIARLLEADL